MTPLSGNTLLFLPASPSFSSQSLEGLFELTRRPSRALDSPRMLLPELQRCKDTVRLAKRSQDTVSNNWRKPWLCVCRKRTYLHRSSIVKSQQKRIELVTRPAPGQSQAWAAAAAQSPSGAAAGGLGFHKDELSEAASNFLSGGRCDRFCANFYFSRNFIHSEFIDHVKKIYF